MRNKGFSFIELLVAISIVAILTGAVLMVLNPSLVRGKTRNGTRVNDIKNLQSALEVYRADQSAGKYPISASWCNPQTNTCLGTALGSYIRSIPADPQGFNTAFSCTGTNHGYLYRTDASGDNFLLITYLEGSVPAGVTLCANLPNWTTLSGCAAGQAPAGCVGVTNL